MGQAQDFRCQDIVFLSHFEDLPDPRQAAKVLYPLSEVLLVTLVAVLCGAESWVEIAKFGEKRRDFLRRFAPFENGTPSHDQLGDIFAVLDAEAFQSCFIGWVSSLTGLAGDIVAIDGKTLRRAYQQAGRKGAIHMISAFSAGQRLVLGQMKIADKSNEITAIPQLLELLSLKGAIVTIDAMGCQRHIAQKILDIGADYVLALKSLPRTPIRGQSGEPSRGCRALFPGAKGTQFQGYHRRSPRHGGEKPWPHRNKGLHGSRRYHLAPRAP